MLLKCHVLTKGRVQKKKEKKNVDRGRTLGGGGSGKIFAGPQFYCDFWKILCVVELTVTTEVGADLFNFGLTVGADLFNFGLTVYSTNAKAGLAPRAL